MPALQALPAPRLHHGLSLLLLASSFAFGQSPKTEELEITTKIKFKRTEAMIAANVPQIDVVDNDLMLDGLCRLYRRINTDRSRES